MGKGAEWSAAFHREGLQKKGLEVLKTLASLALFFSLFQVALCRVLYGPLFLQQREI